MEWLWSKIKRFFQVLFSYLIALARLVIWTILFFFTGLQRTLFMRCEVASAELRILPLRCDLEDTDEKLAYIDKLCSENPDLMELADEEAGMYLNNEDDGLDYPEEGEE